MTVLCQVWHLSEQHLCPSWRSVERTWQEINWCICFHVCSWAACDHKQLIWRHVNLSPEVPPPHHLWTALWRESPPRMTTVDSRLQEFPIETAVALKPWKRQKLLKKWTPSLCQLWGCYSWKWALPNSNTIQKCPGLPKAQDLPQLDGAASWVIPAVLLKGLWDLSIWERH